MADDKDISAGEAIGNAVELGAALASTTPVAAAGIWLAAKVPGWITRITSARADAWWRGFLSECRRDGLGIDEIREQIAKEVESNPATADVIMGHMRDVLDSSITEVVSILGALRGAYYGEGRAPDAFFRCAAALLKQCTEQDLAAVRELTGRLSCIAPTTKSRTLGVSVIGSSIDDGRRHRVAQIEMDTPGATSRREILGLAWEAGPLWKRLPHLLVSTGLARADGQPYDFFVEYDDMRRLHAFLRQRGICQGEYRCYRRGSNNAHFAELEAIPACFGYGETPEEALDSLKRNLRLFVDDAETATLMKVSRPPEAGSA